jgi:hypothetical protein
MVRPASVSIDCIRSRQGSLATGPARTRSSHDRPSDVSLVSPRATQVLIRTDGGKLAAAFAQKSSSLRSFCWKSFCTQCHFEIEPFKVRKKSIRRSAPRRSSVIDHRLLTSGRSVSFANRVGVPHSLPMVRVILAAKLNGLAGSPVSQSPAEFPDAALFSAVVFGQMPVGPDRPRQINSKRDTGTHLHRSGPMAAVACPTYQTREA